MDDPQALESPRTTLARLLAWQREMGVDAVISNVAVDWLAPNDQGQARAPGHGFKLSNRVATTATPDTLPSSQTVRPALPGRPAPAATGVRARTAPADIVTPSVPAGARGPTVTSHDLAALQADLERYDGCALKKHATKLCLYRGADTARLMVIGEAPGRDEDLAGRPFVGRGGQLLDRMLAAIGLGEGDAHIANAVYWRPPGNRQPTPQETLACRPFLDRQIDLVNPEILLLMGGIATASLLESSFGIMRLRGKWTTLSRPTGRPIRVLPTLHPDYLLRSPAAKRQAWNDLLLLRRALDGET